MPSLAPTMDEDPPSPDRWPTDLASLRAEIDGIDDAIHDLLMRRAAVVQQVAAAKGTNGGVALRPGREAVILRRLLERHHGTLPRQAIVRIWRELLAATTAMQSMFVVAVCDTDPAASFTQLAREQFGALTPIHVHRSPPQSIAELSAGRASAAVLPLPSDTEPASQAWWTALLQNDEPRIHIVGRLPFWSPRPDGAPAVQALIAAAMAPDPSGDDRTLLGLELDRETSRARLAASLAAADLASGGIILRRDPNAPVAHVLAEVPGFLTEDDPRLARISAVLRPPVVLGAYAVPVGTTP